MGGVEYRVVPAPKRGVKAKGAKTGEERLAAALSEVMNALGAEGWDYVRSDVLPCEERQGLTGRTTVYHTVLVFRRAVAEAGEWTGPVVAGPVVAGPVVAGPVVAGPVMSPAALPAFLTPAPRTEAPPLINPAPPLGPAERLAAE
jgi:hypothetical protein